ncbi:MAG TPA: SxtJ family membrane protein [Gemmatimonadales bacterium]|nr:SxtJ family membrane protein [Gemmatimonadales bacterium]
MATRVPARLSAAEGRRFGLTVGGAFVVLGGLAWWRGRLLTAGVATGVGLALVIAALVVPARLGPIYRLWMGLAAAMSKVTTPVFMGIIYFAVVTPTGLLRRLAGKDSLVRPRTAKSFWVSRAADAQRRAGMERQF